MPLVNSHNIVLAIVRELIRADLCKGSIGDVGPGG